MPIIQNQILSLTCLPIPPNELVLIKMPQFDILTLNAQIFGLVLTLYLFYYFNITNPILKYSSIKKYRTKKLVKNNFTIKNSQTSLDNNYWLLKNSYREFLD
jgi:hypothetical protein